MKKSVFKKKMQFINKKAEDLKVIDDELGIKKKQKPIRVETCNARSQLPNIQCEPIG